MRSVHRWVSDRRSGCWMSDEEHEIEFDIDENLAGAEVVVESGDDHDQPAHVEIPQFQQRIENLVAPFVRQRPRSAYACHLTPPRVNHMLGSVRLKRPLGADEFRVYSEKP